MREIEFLEKIPEDIGLDPQEMGSPSIENDNRIHPIELKAKVVDEQVKRRCDRVEKRLDERFGFLHLV
ncbi:hypothetical protein AKJ38_02310 [candidate division MSBL1 archaeon SCGC-AAA259I14]|uniref:Uncharacterized protein n=1 Tax=candidate division MSBL1 archaeon SCGC-AAA259I14 TaxID=1698268 RepID=A0A133US01_9EURY|nr:hypothetical protein AKJ38_02310 [candidate division MSBL1 archaeon SCGC-AAA259I14]